MQDLLVNFLQYTEYTSDGSILKRFSWVTDLTITSVTTRVIWSEAVVRVGRSKTKRSIR